MEKSTKQISLKYILLFLVISAAALAVRLPGLEHVTADMEECLIPWSAEMKPGYGVSILPTFSGDYNMPYVTILWLLNYLPGRTIVKVKLVSILFDYLASIAGGLIVMHVLRKEKNTRDLRGVAGKLSAPAGFLLAYGALLFYPSGVLNGAYWGQCDYIYVAFVLFMVYGLLKNRPALAMLMLGCAFSFKLQAILALPILCIYLWKKRPFSLWYVLLVPAVMELLCVPAILGGSSIFVPFTIYLRQLGRYPYMYVFYPGLWAIFPNAQYYVFSLVANLGVLTGLGIFAVFLIQKKREVTEFEWLKYMVWTIFCMMCFLPCMHERYGMLLEVAAILVGILDWRFGICAAGLGIGSYISYLQVTFGKNYFPDRYIAVCYLALFCFMTWLVIRDWRDAENGGAETPATDEPVWMRLLNLRLPWIGVCLLVVFGLLIRKNLFPSISADYLPNLIEMDDNYHTPLYMLWMKVLALYQGRELFFNLKVFCTVTDLAAALWGTYVITRICGPLGSAKKMLLFAMAWSAPAVYLNSSMWGHLDSFVLLLVFTGLLLLWNDRRVVGSILLGLGCGILSHYLVFAAILVIWTCRKKRRQMGVPLAFMTATMLLTGFIGLPLGYGISESFWKLISQPAIPWSSIGGWAGAWVTPTLWMLYPVSLGLSVLALYRKEWIAAAMALQLTLLLNYGVFLYEYLIFPNAFFVICYAVSLGFAAAAFVMGARMGRYHGFFCKKSKKI